MNEDRNKRMIFIIEDALQIARLKANGSYKEGNRLVKLSDKDVEQMLTNYRYSLETKAMDLLLSQEIEYEQ